MHCPTICGGGGRDLRYPSGPTMKEQHPMLSKNGVVLARRFILGLLYGCSHGIKEEGHSKVGQAAHARTGREEAAYEWAPRVATPTQPLQADVGSFTNQSVTKFTTLHPYALLALSIVCCGKTKASSLPLERREKKFLQTVWVGEAGKFWQTFSPFGSSL